jgi:serine/threonine-protein kinase
MRCPDCGSPVPDGAAACTTCGRSFAAGAQAAVVSTLTPTDSGGGRATTAEQIEPLGARLQDALGEAYRVEGQLGAGGFAVVYLVRDLRLKRKLAVKVLSPDVIQSRTALERFRREAETVAQLSHPNIVPLHFVGQKDDLVYLVMECVEGGSLADRVQRVGSLPPEEVTRILREVASALAHAHRRGVIHRDIKPHNVLLEAESGRCLVTDFGIARTAEGAALTASGMMVGTPAYLSPEQVTGHEPDHRADIYALGVMGYEMLTGHPPFQGPTPTAVLMQRLAGPPTPIQKERPEVPQALRDVVDGCLAQDPAERFQSAADVVRALGGQTPVSGGHSTAQLVLKRRRRRRAWLVAFGITLPLAALGVATLVLGRGTPPGAAPVPDTTLVLVPGGSYTVGLDDGPEISRPAHTVASDSFAIGRREVTAGEYRRFVDSTRAEAPWGTAVPDPRLPVTGVRYAEALSYCVWRYGTNAGLPTEEQWESAARGAEGRRYPWGDEPRAGAANTASAGRSEPAPPGSFPQGRTPSGLEDMVGNVWEWTSSRLAPYPGGRLPAPYASFRGYNVLRGGAFNTPDALATATSRGASAPDAERRYLQATGFRCVVALPRAAAERN